MSTRTVALDWQNLGFGFVQTNGFIQVEYCDGRWGDPVVMTDPHVSLHIAASCLHYGQACFEGLKAFQTRGGDVVLFRPEQNARRMIASANRICMQGPPETLFVEVCREVVRLNRDYAPPYGTGASLYLRPVLLGTEPVVGLEPSSTYLFIVLATPVGPYYRHGFRPVEALVIEDFDRAAPQGTGRAKVAGNYAASLRPGIIAKEAGCPIVLFTDPREHKYVDEFSTSNFLCITGQGEYKTPDSSSILPSITNDSLRVLAREMGLTVVRGPIPVDSLDQFCEVGACGTAAVITPISAIHCRGVTYRFGSPDTAGPTLTKLYRQLQGIQYGELPDTHQWLLPVG